MHRFTIGQTTSLVSLAAMLMGCDGGGGAGSGGTGGMTDTGTDTSRAPVITGTRIVPNPKNHLAVTVEFTTDRPATATVEVDDGADHRWVVDPGEAPSTEHAIDVLGLRPERGYAFSVVATDADGLEGIDEGSSYQTDPLPDDFPEIVVDSTPEDMQPGWTLLNVMRWKEDAVDSEWGLAVAVDETGEVVWYSRARQVSDLRRASNGNVWMLIGHNEVRVVDPMGNILRSWFRTQVLPELDTLHHEAFEMPSGNLLALSTELRTIDGYDDGMGGTVSHDVVGDLVVELTPEGELVHSRSMLDLLPDAQLRVLQGFDTPFWDSTYEDEAPDGTKDWSHGNAAVYDAERDLILVSLRHQDWIVAYERETGALAWRLGPEGDFDLAAGGQWFYHQHAPQVLPDGALMIYDNANTNPDQWPPSSRAVEMDLDTSNWTATQVWSWTSGEYAPFVGDADKLENGNVLVADGGLVSSAGLPPNDPTNVKFVRISEVDPGTGTIVFDLRIGSADAEASYTTYRAARIEPL